MIRFPSPQVALTGLLMAASTAAAATTPAGTLIENQAAANFDPVSPGGPTQALSNKVVTVVQAVCAVSVTNSGFPEAMAMGGDIVEFGFNVTNAGNQTYSLPLSLTGSGLAPAPTLTLYLDANGNGKVDSGEQPVSAVNLPAGGSAKVVAQVKLVEGSMGQGLITLVTSCGGTGGSSAATARVRVAPPPRLEVTKSFSPAVFKPGDETTVNVSTVNSSTYASREVILTDSLAAQAAQGLVYVPGSATTNVGVIEYSADGASWSTSAPSTVMAIRVRVETLGEGEVINLSFRMKAEEKADGQKVINTATASTSGQNTSGSATADIHYNPAVAIGPAGQAEAPEGTPADTQTRPFAVVGQQICFDHTLKNTGDVQDSFRVTVTFPQGQAQVDLPGLVQPLVLKPGETAQIRVCYTPTATGPLTGVVTATGDRGTSNATTDIIADIQNGLPELKKSYVAETTDENGKPKTLADGATVAVGDTVTYTLSVRNPYNRPLTNVVVTDPIPAHVDFVSATGNGQMSGAAGQQSVTWNLGTLAAGETRTFTIVTKVSDRSVDGEVLVNIFNMVSSELPEALPSNEVKTPVWNAQLIIDKKVSASTVTYGDKVTYTLAIRNASATTPIESAIVTDTPAKGLEYVPGTALLGGKPLADPVIENGVMKWNAGTIPANGEIQLQYDMRVTPAANGDLLNVATVAGIGAGGAARAIASNRAQATTKLDPLKFAPLSDIIGVVFVDRNRNGKFDAGLDTPVDRARVILAGGRLALTDLAGRYHFSNVPNGTWALRLDPNTTPYPPLKLSQEGGLSGTQTVHVRGLTSVDFPLAPLGGDISALRRTSLTIGDVSLEKSIFAVEGGYVVSIRINTPRALTDFHLEDPLPGGAVLKEGRNTLTTTLKAGETNLTYRFDWTGHPSGATTDPVVSWR